MEQSGRRPGWAVPVVGVVLVVALVVIGLNRGPADFDPDTPEGTVQTYIDAIVRGDYDTAASLWHREGCIPESTVPTREYSVSASLVRVGGGDEEATVEVRITETTTDPFGNVTEYQEWFNLVRVADGWRIRQPSWPYYDQPCEESE